MSEEYRQKLVWKKSNQYRHFLRGGRSGSKVSKYEKNHHKKMTLLKIVLFLIYLQEDE